MKKLLLVLLIFTCLTRSYGAPKYEQHKSNKRSIIAPPGFPKNRISLIPETDMAYDCQGNMCNGTLEYPIRYLERMMRYNNHIFDDIAGSALKPYEDVPFIDRWLDEDEEQVNMCNTKEYFMIPKVARNVDYEWKFVVQIGNITQSVQYDKCSEKSYCFAHEFIPNNYATTCKQHKVVIRLWTLQPNGTISQDYIAIPGGCACAYSKIT